MLSKIIKNPEKLSSLLEIEKNIKTTINSLRTLIFDISPTILYQLGLTEAVKWFFELKFIPANIKAEFVNSNFKENITEDLKILLFHIIRELVINIIKHAKAKNVYGSIKVEKKNLLILIQDDGIGIKSSINNDLFINLNNFGLFSIKERLKHLGGVMSIKSVKGKGTKINLKLPISN